MGSGSGLARAQPPQTGMGERLKLWREEMPRDIYPEGSRYAFLATTAHRYAASSFAALPGRPCRAAVQGGFPRYRARCYRVHRDCARSCGTALKASAAFTHIERRDAHDRHQFIWTLASADDFRRHAFRFHVTSRMAITTPLAQP